MREAPVVKVVATALSLVVALADNRQITFQSGFEGDETDEVVNERLDRLMRLADRQKARYEIETVDEDIIKHKKALAQMLEDLESLEANHERQMAVRHVELEERKRIRPAEKQKMTDEMNAGLLDLSQRREALLEEGAAQYRAAGRQGRFKPTGALAANLEKFNIGITRMKEAMDKDLANFDENYDAQIAVAEAEIHKAEEERKAAVANLDRSIIRFGQELGFLSEKRAKLQAKLEG